MSTIRANTLTDAAGNNSSTAVQIQQGRAKCWATYNGTGTISLRDSFGVSSLTDVAVGNYEINLTAVQPNRDYSCGHSYRNATSGEPAFNAGAWVGNAWPNTTSIIRQAATLTQNNTHSDIDVLSVQIHGD